MAQFILFWTAYVMISEIILDLGISVQSLVAHIYHKSNAYHRTRAKKKCVTWHFCKSPECWTTLAG